MFNKLEENRVGPCSSCRTKIANIFDWGMAITERIFRTDLCKEKRLKEKMTENR